MRIRDCNPGIQDSLDRVTRSLGVSSSVVNNGQCDVWAKAAKRAVGGDVVYLSDYHGYFDESDVEPDGWGHDPGSRDHCVLRRGGLYYDAENTDGVRRIKDLNFLSRSRLSNPPDTPVPSRVRRAIRHGDIPDLGKPLGCGKFGCTYPRGDSVLKVTSDPHEIDVVREIIAVRKAKIRRDPRTVKTLASIGVSVTEASRLPGIVLIKSAPRRRGKVWAYLREDVKPLDAMKDSMASLRMDAVGEALEEYFYSKRPPSASSFVLKNPWAREIVASAVYLESCGLQLEDVHEEQTAVVMKSTATHRRGTVVLYDYQM